MSFYRIVCNNLSVSWLEQINSSNPEVPLCAQYVFLPLFILLYSFICITYIIWLNKQKLSKRPLRKLYIFRLIFILILLLLQIVEIIYTIAKSLNYVYIISNLFIGLSLVIFILIQRFERLVNAPNSGFCFNFWILLLLLFICKIYSCCIRIYLNIYDNLGHEVFIILQFAIIAICFILNNISDRMVLKDIEYYESLNKKSKVLKVPVQSNVENIELENGVLLDNSRSKPEKIKNLCPENYSSFLNRICFFWFTSLVWKGYKKPLVFDDLWKINENDSTNVLMGKFQKLLHHYIFSKIQINISKKETFIEDPVKVKDENQNEANKSLMNDEQKNKDKKKNSEFDPGLLYALIKANWFAFLYSGFLKLGHDILIFLGPILLKYLINFIASDSKLIWQGYAIAIALLLTAIIRTFVLQMYFHEVMRIGMNIRTSLVSSIYRKSLVLSNWARKDSTVGEIVNHMSVDAQKFLELLSYLHTIWSGPFQIIVAVFLIWKELGPSVIGGLVVMILLIPINAVIGNMTRVLQSKQLKFSDERIKMMNEILNGIKVLKLYAWENSFIKFITEIRKKEMNLLRKSAYLNAATTFTFTCAPFVVSLTSFGLYVLISKENILDAEKIFVSLSLFNIIRFPMMMLPMVIASIIQTYVSLNRLTHYFKQPEIDTKDVTHEKMEGIAVQIKNGNFSWDPQANNLVLQNINLTVKEGQVVGIVGSVGTGKSTLLSAILGEVYSCHGENNNDKCETTSKTTINVYGKIAYVPQQAWIINDTLKENILFGLPYDACKYMRVLKACCLERDIEILKDGDMTEIGEKGINLSGGQKQRISLARACYSECDIYLMDDPLSAVDSHVGRDLMKNVLFGPDGLLAEKTRILVTHNLSVLPGCDHIMVMETNGIISEEGTYSNLMNKPQGNLSAYIATHMGSNKQDEKVISDDLKEIDKVVMDDVEVVLDKENEDKECEEKLRQIGSKLDSKADKLIEDEKAAEGNVKLSVYWTYIRSVGICLAIAIIFLFILAQCLNLGSNLWLVRWSRQAKEGENLTLSILDFKGKELSGTITKDEEKLLAEYESILSKDRALNLGIYAAFGFGQVLTQLICSIVFANGYIRAACKLHDTLLIRVLRFSIGLFESIPVGRILNRFSSDVLALVAQMPHVINGFLLTFLSTITVLIMVVLPNIWVILPLALISILYIGNQRFYVATSRQLKRLDSVSKSPIYSHFSESLQGVTSIRAYSLQEKFIKSSDDKVDTNLNAYYCNVVSNRWLAIILETIGNLIVFLAAMFSVISKQYSLPVDAGLVGLSVSYSLSITQTLNWMVRMSSEVESNIVSVERIQEYCNKEPEAEWEIPDKKPSEDWPQGSIEFRKYSTRYREGMDLVLKEISIHISAKQKIGIVGRTGSGKSTLVLALFRILEKQDGEIVIDGIPIHELGLHDLRSRLTIIPQDPVLFSGTLRNNIDPFRIMTDDELWKALEQSNLKDFVSNSESKLDMKISEGGENLSVGQRQLVCLSRALLRHTKILVLDEATAAVDMETDALIQKTIRKEFNDCTILTIAHRLNTVMDYDRLIVLDRGQILETGTVKELLNNKDSEFYSMAKDAKLVPE